MFTGATIKEVPLFSARGSSVMCANVLLNLLVKGEFFAIFIFFREGFRF